MKFLHQHPFDDTENLLKTGILVSLLTFFLELGVGVWAGSLALLSDAWHVFIDIWALVISFLAIYLAQRPVSHRRTYGLHRMEVMAALVNGFLVLLIALGIIYSAVKRFYNPPQVHGTAVAIMGVVGLILNGLVAGLFYKKSEHDMNLRGVFLHLIGDALSSVAVLVSGVVMVLTGWRQIDPIISVLIALIVLVTAYRLLRESFETLLEGVPRGIVVNKVEEEITRVDGVVSVHDLHIWSICSHLKALSGHVLVAPASMPQQDKILEGINRGLKDRFGISHTTIQVESKAWPGVEKEY